MRTLKSSFNIKGVGLMSGIEFEVEIKPTETKGIYFTCGDKKIKANTENVVSSEHCVVVANINEGADFKAALIEHFMAACAICNIDGLEMNFKNPGFDVPIYEVPILDGSSKMWVEKFNNTGYQGDKDNYPVLNSPTVFERDRSTVAILPSKSKTKISYMVNFNHPDLSNRWSTLELDKNLNEIIGARTFGYLKDLETFQKMGLSKGVAMDNTVGLTEDGYTTDLRSQYEPNKHKILDIIGDLYLTGINPLRMNANIIVKEAGHALHIEAAKLMEKNFAKESDYV